MTTKVNNNVGSHYTPLNDTDENVERTCAELRIYPGDMHPNAVTHLLGIQPTRTVAIGERIQVKRPDVTTIGKVNGWFLSSEEHVQSNDLRRHLDWLIAQLQSHHERLLKLQTNERVYMYISCPWWSRYGGGGPSLWPTQMRGLAELNLECKIDFADYSNEQTRHTNQTTENEA